MTRLPKYLQGKNPKTLLEVFEDYEEDEMPVVKGKHYGKKGEYTAKDKQAAAKARKSTKSGGKRK